MSTCDQPCVCCMEIRGIERALGAALDENRRFRAALEPTTENIKALVAASEFGDGFGMADYEQAEEVEALLFAVAARAGVAL